MYSDEKKVKSKSNYKKIFDCIVLYCFSLCATGQDFHRMILSLYVDNQLAIDYFCRLKDSQSSDSVNKRGNELNIGTNKR